MTFGDPIFFLQHNHEVDICGFEWNSSSTFGWIAVTFAVSLRINYNNFGDPSTFHPGPASGLNFFLFDTLVDD